MTATAAPLTFRAAFPDESGRAAFLDGGTWEEKISHCFLAVTDGPPERITGAVRHSYGSSGIRFRIIAGAGGELAGNESEFLRANVDQARQTVNLAHRLGGHVTAMMHQRSRRI
jgi:hypothetical protein